MEFRVLGPVEIAAGAGAVRLGEGRQRSVLVLLLLHRNATLSSERMIDALWGERPPPTAAKVLQNHVSQLRRALGEHEAARLQTRVRGYALRVEPGELDLDRFEQLLRAGGEALSRNEPAEASARLRDALALWRGPALADVAYESFAQPEITRLEERRLLALEQRVDADLMLGQHAEAVAELEALVAEHPLRERPRAQLMLALYRSGRQAEALESFQWARRALIGELGVEPGPLLRDLQVAILRQDPQLAPAPGVRAHQQRTAASSARTPDRIFVGRARHLVELMAGVEDLERGRGSLVLLRGEPGIGKTWLAEEVAARAAERGARVLWGRCWESGGAPAFWPWVQGLRKLVEQTEPDTLAAQLGAGAVDVARIVPELRDLIPSLPPTPAGDPEGVRFRLFDAVTTLLRNATRARPIVLVLDDLHAADAPSLLLLRFLTDALADTPLLVIATRRDSDRAVGENFAATLAELARSERFHDVAVGGLGQEEVAELVDAAGARDGSDETVAAIYERTDGHPFFVAELVRVLASEGRLDAIPPGVRAVVARRLGELSQDCRRVLAVASVVGREFSSDAIARAAEDDPGRISEALGQALRASTLVSLAGAPGHFRFAHGLVRDVVYDELSINDRARLHRQVAEALETIYSPELDRHLAELAHHFYLGGPGQSAARAVDYAGRAAQRAIAELAYEEAARLYEMAVIAHERDPGADAVVRGELLLGLAAAQASAGDMITAKETFVRAADVARGAGMAEPLARAALGLGGSHVSQRVDDARVLPLLEEALVALGETGGVLRARLLALLARAAAQPSVSLDAVDLARRLGDPATLAWTLHARAPFLWEPDQIDELLALSEEMLATVERAQDPEQALNGHLLRFGALVTLGRTAAARDELAIAAQLARDLRLPWARWHVAVHEAEFALLGGHFAAAEALIEQARQLGERSSSAEVVTTGVVQRFPLLLEQRRLEELRPALQEIATAQPQVGMYRCLLARLESEVGNHTSARAMLERLARDDWAALDRDSNWLLAVALLAETTAVLNHEECASRLYDLLAPYTSLVAAAPHFFPIGVVSRYVGILAAVLSRLDDAARWLEDAAATNATIGAHAWAAHAKADLARVLLTRQAPGDPQRAGDLLHEALTIHERLGMTASTNRVAALRAELSLDRRKRHQAT